VDVVADPVADAEPQLAERGEVRLVVDHDGQVVAAQPPQELFAQREIGPAEVRGEQEVPGADVDHAGNRDPDACDDERLSGGRLERRLDETRSALEHARRRDVPVVDRLDAVEADPMEEVGDADREVVDVDLQPDAAVQVAVDAQRAPRPADAAVCLRADLDEKAEAEQFLDEHRHRALRESRRAGDLGAADAPPPGRLAHHDGEVVAADVDRASRGPAHARIRAAAGGVRAVRERRRRARSNVRGQDQIIVSGAIAGQTRKRAAFAQLFVQPTN
jgi:hypothetical protein